MNDNDAPVMVWIDCEMSGLDPERERLLEIAVLVTNSELEVLAEGPVLAIHQSDECLAGMDEWNQRTHGASGLVERVRASKLDEAEAERQVLEFLGPFAESGCAHLAGNSVGQDRRFLERYMRKLNEYLHYRIIDVSTIKELARRWYPKELEAAPPKREVHRALDDIRESLAELRYYRETIFRA